MLVLCFRKFSRTFVRRIQDAVLLYMYILSKFRIRFMKFDLFALIATSVSGIFSPPWTCKLCNKCCFLYMVLVRPPLYPQNS